MFTDEARACCLDSGLVVPELCCSIVIILIPLVQLRRHVPSTLIHRHNFRSSGSRQSSHSKMAELIKNPSASLPFFSRGFILTKENITLLLQKLLALREAWSSAPGTYLAIEHASFHFLGMLFLPDMFFVCVRGYYLRSSLRKVLLSYRVYTPRSYGE